MAGISQPRNTGLAQIFFRLKHIEAYGTGIRRIYELYRNDAVKPEISVTENTFRIVLPNRNFRSESDQGTSRLSENTSALYEYNITSQMKKVLDHLSQYATITDQELMELLKLKRTRAYLVARQMAEMGLIDIIGRGRTKKYVLHHSS